MLRVLSCTPIPPALSPPYSLHQNARQISPPHRQRAANYTFADDDMCAALGILCAGPRVGAALRFVGDGDAEIEDDADDDRPRVFPRSLQTKIGQRNRGASRHCRLIAFRVLLVVISASFESVLLFALSAPPPIGSERAAFDLVWSAWAVTPASPTFGPRLLRRRSRHGQQPLRHADEHAERPCPS
jgi:hypothetical protein